jgi:hypothetical protein
MKHPSSNRTESVLSRLDNHPRLLGHLERLLDLCEDVGGDLRRADAVEQRVIEQMRGLGRDVLQDRAGRQLTARREALDQAAGVWRDGKNFSGTACSETSVSKSRNIGKKPNGGVH